MFNQKKSKQGIRRFAKLCQMFEDFEPIMTEWISIDQDLPKQNGRYLVFTRCKNGIHNCLAWDYRYACCDINIAYFHLTNFWQFSSEEGDPPVNLTHWKQLPKSPEE